jgi:radical SAM superfamily enzyme YgiQ (UPF0313 family)
MQSLRKACNSIAETEEAIGIIQDHGIAFHPSIVLGLDTETPAIFYDTLEFLHRNRIPSPILNVMTPYPGTRIHERLEEEGRLISDDWYYYDRKCVVFRPKNMSPEELREGNALGRRLRRTTGIQGRVSSAAPSRRALESGAGRV